MDQAWWRQGVIYQIYVRSFADGSGDGTGDLAGATARLGELAALGVDAVWLTPFYVSPMADGGYDVADPMAVDPLFGDLRAFDALRTEAGRLGLRVLVDLVPNHTSSEHAWFRDAVASPDSPMRDRYLFRDLPADGGWPNNWPSDFGGPAWSMEPSGAQAYLHLFAPEQPDLDWRNPDVADYWLQVLRFWLDRGVDGFRIDVAHGLVKQADLASNPPEVGEVMGRADLPMWNQPEVHEIYRSWRALLDSYSGDRMMVGEVYLYDQDVVADYVGPAGLHQSFDFSLQLQPFSATELGETILGALQSLAPRGALPTWVLANHDLVRSATRYGGGPHGRERAVAAMALVLGLPGSPYIYQGEELAAEQVEVAPELRQDPIWERSGHTREGRDGARTPLPWSASGPGYGFTAGMPWLPMDPAAVTVNVATQRADPTAPWSVIARFLALRKELLPGLGDTVERTLSGTPDGVLLLSRTGGLLIVLNATDDTVDVPMWGSVTVLDATSPCTLAGGMLSLPPRTTAWVRSEHSADPHA